MQSSKKLKQKKKKKNQNPISSSLKKLKYNQKGNTERNERQREICRHTPP